MDGPVVRLGDAGLPHDHVRPRVDRIDCVASAPSNQNSAAIRCDREAHHQGTDRGDRVPSAAKRVSVSEPVLAFQNVTRVVSSESGFDRKNHRARWLAWVLPSVPL